MGSETSVYGTALINGRTSGILLASHVELSFWGGVDAQSGEIIDRHHPLSSKYLQDVIFAIPCGRGSCSGSGVILELLLNGNGPKALIFSRPEDILTLGVIVARELFERSIPVLQLSAQYFQQLPNQKLIHINGGKVSWGSAMDKDAAHSVVNEPKFSKLMQLSDLDNAYLSGKHGQASAAAMRIILEMSRLQGVQRLIDVTQVHIDGCVYTGPGSLAFAEKLRDLGGKVAVPTTLNSISVDQKRWRSHGVEPTFGTASEKLGSTYTDMGARPTFTCAPYLLDSAPKQGDQIAWAESNAVVYANSVLGAKTMKYPDFLDIAIALTGRAPYGGLHLAENRVATLLISIVGVSELDLPSDLLYPAIGYGTGRLSGSRIPVIVGLHGKPPSKDDLKAFGAAFATVSSAPMFHILGITPEAYSLEAATGGNSSIQQVSMIQTEIYACIEGLNTATRDEKVDLISLGNPHFSLPEMRKLANMCRGKSKHPSVAIIVCCGRSVYGLASQAGLIAELEAFGIQIIEDTCWCMIGDPVIQKHVEVIMTSSAKYAHYGPGLTGRRFRFGGLEECVESACLGIP
ncbi:hypothetical protein Q7P37_003397 [Cladosporium fusiforme]